VAGALVRFAIRGGRATFSGARTLSVTTDAAGRAVAAGFAPSGSGALQIGVTAAFQGQTAAAVSIAQTTVMSAAQAAAATSAGAGAGGAGGGASAGAGAGAGGGGGLSATTIGVVAGAVAGGVVGVKALGSSGTTLRGDYSGQFVMAAQVPGGCTFVETLTGTVTITLDDPGSATGTVEVKEQSSVTSTTCGNLGNSANDEASGPLAGTPNNLTFNLQKTNPLTTGTRTKPWSFVGQFNGSEITGVLTTGDIAPGLSAGVVFRGSASIPITLR
jgi:hypothetical protein